MAFLQCLILERFFVECQRETIAKESDRVGVFGSCLKSTFLNRDRIICNGDIFSDRRSVCSEIECACHVEDGISNFVVISYGISVQVESCSTAHARGCELINLLAVVVFFFIICVA